MTTLFTDFQQDQIDATPNTRCWKCLMVYFTHTSSDCQPLIMDTAGFLKCTMLSLPSIKRARQEMEQCDDLLYSFTLNNGFIIFKPKNKDFDGVDAKFYHSSK